MLKLFFHRYSVMVRLMEVIGILGLAAAFWKHLSGAAPLTLTLTLILIEYLFLRLCTFRRWYGKTTPSSYGIGLQFLKAMVPASYILAIMMWSFVFLKSSLILLIAAALLAVIAHVNVILIWLHRKDPDKTAANLYSMTH